MALRPLSLLLLLACSLGLPLLLAGFKIPLSKTHDAKDGGHPHHIRTPWQKWERGVAVAQHVVFGQRVPRRYFTCKGFGETDQGSGTDPYETGAYDLAIEAAGVHNFNIMTYTSILPREAEEISFEEAQKYFHHGAVLECIMAKQNGGRGDRVTAGVGRMMVGEKSANGRRMGGFAVEYEGHASEEVARQQLDEALACFDRRFSLTDHGKEEKLFTIASMDVKRAFGTAIAGICFVDYVVPVLPNDLATGKAEGGSGASWEL